MQPGDLNITKKHSTSGHPNFLRPDKALGVLFQVFRCPQIQAVLVIDFALALPRTKIRNEGGVIFLSPPNRTGSLCLSISME